MYKWEKIDNGYRVLKDGEYIGDITRDFMITSSYSVRKNIRTTASHRGWSFKGGPFALTREEAIRRERLLDSQERRG